MSSISLDRLILLVLALLVLGASLTVGRGAVDRGHTWITSKFKPEKPPVQTVAPYCAETLGSPSDWQNIYYGVEGGLCGEAKMTAWDEESREHTFQIYTGSTDCPEGWGPSNCFRLEDDKLVWDRTDGLTTIDQTLESDKIYVQISGASCSDGPSGSGSLCYNGNVRCETPNWYESWVQGKGGTWCSFRNGATFTIVYYKDQDTVVIR